MKKIFLFLCIGIFMMSCEKDETLEIISDGASSLKSTTYTVSTESALRSAVSSASAGDVIYVSGTIYLTSTLQLTNSGSSGSYITITGGSNYATIDCSGVSGWGIKCNGSFWKLSYLNICNAGDCGLVFQYGGNNYVFHVRTFSCGDSGLQIYNSSYDNTISYCTSYDNYDEADGGENADGFACKLSAGEGNYFYKCNAKHNSDDGWDLYQQPYTVIMSYCYAYNNGYGTDGDGNGFKLGSSGQDVDHSVLYCTSNDNLAYGYDGNGNTGHITTTGSTGSGNGKGLWYRIY